MNVCMFFIQISLSLYVGGLVATRPMGLFFNHANPLWLVTPFTTHVQPLSIFFYRETLSDLPWLGSTFVGPFLILLTLSNPSNPLRPFSWPFPSQRSFVTPSPTPLGYRTAVTEELHHSSRTSSGLKEFLWITQFWSFLGLIWSKFFFQSRLSVSL